MSPRESREPCPHDAIVLHYSVPTSRERSMLMRPDRCSTESERLMPADTDARRDMSAIADPDVEAVGPAMSRRHAAGAASARGLLFTILGEYVLPAGGSAWTSAVIETMRRRRRRGEGDPAGPHADRGRRLADRGAGRTADQVAADAERRSAAHRGDRANLRLRRAPARLGRQLAAGPGPPRRVRASGAASAAQPPDLGRIRQSGTGRLDQHAC